MPGILQAPKSCPAARCSYVGPNRALAVHWRVAHEERSILFLCPLPGCSYQTPRQHNLRTHWERVHGATRPTSAELRTLPLLADFIVNRNRVDPGECCPPVPPLRLPVGSLPQSDKHTLLVRVQVIPSGEQPQREPAATQQHPSVSGVVPETPEVFPAEETSQSGQPDAAPMETKEQCCCHWWRQQFRKDQLLSFRDIGARPSGLPLEVYVILWWLFVLWVSGLCVASFVR